MRGLLIPAKYLSAIILLCSFLKVSQCGSFVTEDPTGAEDYLKAIDTQKLIDEFNSFGNVPSEFLHKLEAQVQLK